MDISQLASLSQIPVSQSSSRSSTPYATSGSAEVRTQDVFSQSASNAIQAEEKKPDKASIQQAVDQINEVVRSLTSNLEFSVDEETGINVIKVVDNDSGDVIRQIPSEEILAIAKSLNQLQGLMVREKA